MASSGTLEIPSKHEKSYAAVKAFLDVPGLANKKLIAYFVNVVIDEPYRYNAKYEIATRFYSYAILADGSSLRFEMKRLGPRFLGDFDSELIITQPAPSAKYPEHAIGAERINPILRFAARVQNELTVGGLLSYIRDHRLLNYTFNWGTHDGFWHWCVLKQLAQDKYLPPASESDFLQKINSFNANHKNELAVDIAIYRGNPPQEEPHIEAWIETLPGTFD